MEVRFFKNPKDFRNWLSTNHKSTNEQWVGFYKKATGKPSITWPESVDEALCFGWIDGLRKTINDESYKIRFTPRKTNSHWSNVNIRRMKKLSQQKLVTPAGAEAFSKRKEERSGKASYEQKNIQLEPAYEKRIKSNKKALVYFNSLAPSIKNSCIRWVMSARKEETRLRRLEILITSSEQEKLIPPLKWSDKTRI